MNFYFYLWLLEILCLRKLLRDVNDGSVWYLHISRHLEFIIEQGHRVNWVSGSLDSRSLGRWITKCDPVPSLIGALSLPIGMRWSRESVGELWHACVSYRCQATASRLSSAVVLTAPKEALHRGRKPPLFRCYQRSSAPWRDRDVACLCDGMVTISSAYFTTIVSRFSRTLQERRKTL